MNQSVTDPTATAIDPVYAVCLQMAELPDAALDEIADFLDARHPCSGPAGEQFGPDAFRSARHFARWMLRDDRLHMRPRPDLIFADDRATSLVLFREGCWQVELQVGRPGAEITPHRHDHVESVELLISDSGGDALVGDRLYRYREQRGPLAANLIALPLGITHSGRSGSKGSAFLSFQKWTCEPGHIVGDWHDVE